jgi:hypothetical protein
VNDGGQDAVSLLNCRKRPALTSANKQIISEEFKVSLKSITFLLTPADYFCAVNWNTHGEEHRALKLLMSTTGIHRRLSVTSTFFPLAILSEIVMQPQWHLGMGERTKLLCRLNKATPIKKIPTKLYDLARILMWNL